ncbi:hypothetical protein [Paenibacillus sp. KR2-11]|uniref:hypothetical protein n=1 Tax=Paenibacillus sp. KR2-11 TaxID=3385500 RepID=UPI0038FBF0B5
MLYPTRLPERMDCPYCGKTSGSHNNPLGPVVVNSKWVLAAENYEDEEIPSIKIGHWDEYAYKVLCDKCSEFYLVTFVENQHDWIKERFGDFGGYGCHKFPIEENIQVPLDHVNEESEQIKTDNGSEDEQFRLKKEVGNGFKLYIHEGVRDMCYIVTKEAKELLIRLWSYL